MSTSKQTFTQVKDILRKLDRSIDDARERRLRPGLATNGVSHDARNGGGPGSPIVGPTPFRRP